MKTLTILLAGTVALFFSLTVLSENVFIAHPDNNVQLDKVYIQQLYLGKTNTFADGSVAIPINLPEGDATRVQFDQAMLGKNASQMKAYWGRLIFSGKAQPPKTVDSDQQVIELVAKNPSSIGYIKAESVTPGVKVIEKF